MYNNYLKNPMVVSLIISIIIILIFYIKIHIKKQFKIYMSNSVREGWYMAKLYFHWIAAIPLNGSISLTLTDSADIKVTAFSTAYRTFHTFQAANHRRLYKRNARSRKEACGTSERRGKQTAETGEETRAMIEDDQREDINRPSPSLTFWQALSKLNFRIWKKGSAVCLRIPRLAPSLFMSATYGPPEPLSIYNRNLFARRVGQPEKRTRFPSTFTEIFKKLRKLLRSRRERTMREKSRGRGTSEVRLIALLSLADSRTNYRFRWKGRISWLVIEFYPILELWFPFPFPSDR